ncbi:Beta-lactamase [compost metagenome]
MKETPGESTNYNTGCSQLLTAILQQATGNLGAFMEEQLLAPLNIPSYRWQEDPQGVKIGGYGLHLRTADMAKFGQLFLNNGAWDNHQIISEEWVRESTTPRYDNDNPVARMIGRYAYHWWCSDLQNGSRVYFSIGFGGQIIIIAPELDMVVVMTGDNYSNTLRPMNLFKQYIV